MAEGGDSVDSGRNVLCDICFKEGAYSRFVSAKNVNNIFVRTVKVGRKTLRN